MTRIKTLTLIALLGFSIHTAKVVGAGDPSLDPSAVDPLVSSKACKLAQPAADWEDVLSAIFGDSTPATVKSTASVVSTPSIAAAPYLVSTTTPAASDDSVSGVVTASAVSTHPIAPTSSVTLGATTAAVVDHSVPSRTRRGAPPTTAQVGVFSSQVQQSLKDYCASLGEDGLPAQQRTFDPKLQFLIPDGAEGDALKAAMVTLKNVCVLYDVSGSTYDLGGGGGGSRFGGGGRFSRGCGGGRFAGADAESLSASLVPDAKAAEPVGAKTKPIFLAEAEALSLLLKALPHTGMGASNFYLLPFDSSPRMPIGISFPQPVSDPKEYDKLAANLDNILPHSGGGTSLAPALSLMMAELGKCALEDTLLVIVTDGQTDDAERSGRLLSELAAGFTAKSRRLDVLTIGAGSIVSESQPGIALGVSDEGRLMLSKTRFSHFSHVAGGHHSYSGAQCNDAYLKALTLFKSENGGGRYCGAYRDYRDMMQTTLELLSGTNDGSYTLWVQGGVGSFWVPKSHQWDIIKDYKANGTEGADYAYNKSGVVVTVSKDPSAGGLLRVTDEYGRTRCYLFEQKSQLKVKQILDANGLATGTFDVSSGNDEIKARIDWINSHPA